MKLLQIIALALCLNIPITHAAIPALFAPLLCWGTYGFTKMGVKDLEKAKRLQAVSETTSSMEEGTGELSAPNPTDEIKNKRSHATVNFAAGAVFGTMALAATYTVVTAIHYIATQNNQ
jgi:hypothetical protein